MIPFPKDNLAGSFFILWPWLCRLSDSDFSPAEMGGRRDVRRLFIFQFTSSVTETIQFYTFTSGSCWLIYLFLPSQVLAWSCCSIPPPWHPLTFHPVLVPKQLLVKNCALYKLQMCVFVDRWSAKIWRLTCKLLQPALQYNEKHINSSIQRICLSQTLFRWHCQPVGNDKLVFNFSSLISLPDLNRNRRDVESWYTLGATNGKCFRIWSVLLTVTNGYYHPGLRRCLHKEFEKDSPTEVSRDMATKLRMLCKATKMVSML